MDCPDCLKTFNSSENKPRILIPCGHSLCENCIQMRIDTVANKDHKIKTDVSYDGDKLSEDPND